jgi:stress response protein SCP2
LNCSSMDDFVFFSSSKSPCGTVCMKRCRRVGSSGEKVWLW